MEAMKYALLGIVQGLTEFLPVSSSGHLAIAHRIVGIEAELGFDLAVHMGTALAVVIYYFKDFLVYAADIFSTTVRKNGRRRDWDSVGGMKLLLLLVITTIPATIAGLLLEDRVEAAFSSPWAISAFLAVTGAILLLASRKKGGGVGNPVDMSPGTALFIGIAQAFALFPGISRSGMTISSGLAGGLSAGWAVDYSMMASLPVITGAFLFKAVGGGVPLTGASGMYAAIGAVTSLVTGLLAISVLKGLARKRGLAAFAVWVFIAAAANMVLYLVFGI